MDNVLIALIILLGLCAAGIMICCFFKLSKEKQIEMIKQWLLFIVIEAEKELGGGTGQVKLRYVYDLFIDKFGFLARILSFEQFSIYVDESLDLMKRMVANNQNVELYIMKHE